MFLVSAGAFLAVGCSGSGDGERTRTPTEPAATATRSPATAQPTATASLTATAVPRTPTPSVPQLAPIGFPIDPATRTGIVTGAVGSRVIRWGEGPAAGPYSRDDQPSDDPIRANACGWNARTHFEYEGQPAVDWYVPVGTPVVATMDGTATLLINTVANPFVFYGVAREPYIGNPDRSRAPITPFPGAGGGQGVFVRIENRQFRTDMGHLEIGATLKVVPGRAYYASYSPAFDYAGAFGTPRDFRTATLIATWEVRKGEVVGFTGDSGYSEAPHLHYTINPAGEMTALCPTTESRFPDNGWLFRS
jgi:hypothetical protein